MGKYYIKSNGKVYGPVDANKIRERLINGFFSSTSQVSLDRREWMPVDYAEEITMTEVANGNDDGSAKTEVAYCNDDGSAKLEGNVRKPLSVRRSETDDKTSNIGRGTPFSLDNNSNTIANTGINLKKLFENKKITIGLCAFGVLLLVIVNIGIISSIRKVSDDKKKLLNTTQIVQSPTQIVQSPTQIAGEVGKETKDFAEVVDNYQNAVGVVTVTYEDKNGMPLDNILDIELEPTQPIGTAFAIDKNLFATNCHVAYALKTAKAEHQEGLENLVVAIMIRYYRNQGRSYNLSALKDAVHKFVEDKGIRIRKFDIRLNHANGHTISITGVRVHPNYRVNPKDGFKNAEYDVAVLTVKQENSIYFTRADTSELYNLKVAQEIAYIGFPMEGLRDNGNMDIDNPEATFKNGSINKITDFNNVFSSPDRNRSIIHSIPSVGGASGSPIFLKNGHVIAILWGGNVYMKDDGSREASAAQQNYAVRIDVLDKVLQEEEIPIEQWRVE